MFYPVYIQGRTRGEDYASPDKWDAGASFPVTLEEFDQLVKNSELVPAVPEDPEVERAFLEDIFTTVTV